MQAGKFPLFIIVLHYRSSPRTFYVHLFVIVNAMGLFDIEKADVKHGIKRRSVLVPP